MSALDLLESAAKAATPGPWQNCGHNRGGCICGLIWSIPIDGTVGSTARLTVCEAEKSEPGDDYARPSREQMKLNAAFIARANPDAVLKLVAALRAAQRAFAYLGVDALNLAPEAMVEFDAAIALLEAE